MYEGGAVILGGAHDDQYNPLPDDAEWAATRAHLRALLALPGRGRRKFRTLEVTCAACGSLVLEVFPTTPRPAALYRTADRRAPLAMALLPPRNDPDADHFEGGLAGAGCCARYFFNLERLADLLSDRRLGGKVTVSPEDPTVSEDWFGHAALAHQRRLQQAITDARRRKPWPLPRLRG